MLHTSQNLRDLLDCAQAGEVCTQARKDSTSSSLS